MQADEDEDYRIFFLNSYSDYGIRVMCEVSVGIIGQ